MTGQDFIDFAGKLAAAGGYGPPGYRSAVSRAYYGAFLLAREYLAQMNFFARRGDNEHQFVQRHFLNCATADAQEIGSLLSNLHESRKVADYDLKNLPAETSTNAMFCVQRSVVIKNKLIACSAAPVQSKIHDEMIAFRQAANIN